MSVNLEDRPIENVRTEVIDQLIMNYSHGELSYQAFERRLDQAMVATKNAELEALITDLPLTVDKNYQQSKQQKLNANYSEHAIADEYDSFISIFSGNERTGKWLVSKEITMISIFSGASLDFTEAQFTQPVTRIKVFSLFSGDGIYVPENINIVSKAFCVFGSIDNKVNTYSNSDAPTVIIEGISVFSSLTIEIKRTLKEKFIELANSLKGIFS